MTDEKQAGILLAALRANVGDDPAFRRTARLIDELVPAAGLVASRR
ncbi:MAG TPA: hypothetical protein VHK47_02730 [Polyangia bacterium]|jgi:hypothetical protein|nr:hypothetical protein [Polyangia bacterium]